MKSGFQHSAFVKFILFLFMGVMLTPAFASLPAVDSQGNALPSLAPMLKRVTPAVVNIATTGTIKGPRWPRTSHISP